MAAAIGRATNTDPVLWRVLFAVLTLAGGVSIVVGAAFGGVLIDGLGFWALGAFCFVAAVLAALVVWIFVREEPIDLEIAPAV